METPPARNIKLAAALMAVGGACGLAEIVLSPEPLRSATSIGHSPIAGLIDVALGVALFVNADRLTPRELLRKIALVRLVVGGGLALILALAQQNPLGFGVQVVANGALAYLLASRGHRALSAFAVGAFGLCLAAEAVGLQGLATGTNHIAVVRARFSDDFVHPRPAIVTGLRAHYQLPLPEGWELSQDMAARRVNALTDRWLVCPAYDAHVQVISETLEPEQTIDVTRVVDAMVDNIRRSGSGTRELRRGTFANGDPFIEIEVTMRATPLTLLPSLTLQYVLTAKVNGPELIQISAFYPAAARSRAYDRAVAVLNSVELVPLTTLPFAATADDPAPVRFVGPGPIEGLRFAYRLELPARVYLLSPARAHAINPDLDRVLTFSFENAQLYVVAEEILRPMTLDSFEQAFLAARRPAQADLVVDAREPFPGRTDGRLLRFHAVVAGEPQRFVVGLVLGDTVALQIVGNCPTRICQRFEADILQTIRSLSFPTR